MIFGFIVVAAAAAAIGALLAYIADELYHEHQDHPKGTGVK